MKKTIGISIPCFNEEENVVPLCEAVIQIFEKQLPEYNCLIQFIDNCSTDRTPQLLEHLCENIKELCVLFLMKKTTVGNLLRMDF